MFCFIKTYRFETFFMSFSPVASEFRGSPLICIRSFFVPEIDPGCCVGEKIDDSPTLMVF